MCNVTTSILALEIRNICSTYEATWARLMVRRSVVTVRRHTSPPPDTENQLDSWAVLEGLTA